jgi:nucleoside-diphosphate-sugar epimerase
MRSDPRRRVRADSGWTTSAAAAAPAPQGEEVEAAAQQEPPELAALPDAPNVVFMAGQKFGTAGDPSLTWAMNAAVPAFVAERYAGVRTVVFSTGNVYALTPAAGHGARESDAPGPVGEYAWSCLARERIFTAAARRHRTPTAIVRLNYAHDLRYGVLTDLATRIMAGEPVDVAMGHVNVIWQGDANALALASLTRAATPEPFIVNVAGADVLRVADLAQALASRLGRSAQLTGIEAADALLSDSTRMRTLLDDPLMPLDTLLDWVADWVSRGGRLLGKPTKFERRDGRF